MFKIYVASLADYNAGTLHGTWIELDHKSKDEVLAEIQAMLAQSIEQPAEEWAIHDYEGFGSKKLSEWEDIGELCEYVETILSSDYDPDLIEGVCSDLDISAEEAIKYIEDNYHGFYQDFEEYVVDSVTNSGDLSSFSQYYHAYIDWQAMARDWKYNGDYMTIETDNGVHVLFSR